MALNVPTQTCLENGQTNRKNYIEETLEQEDEEKATSTTIYLYKILRQVSEIKMGISGTSIFIIEVPMMENIANEAGRLTAHSKNHTRSSRDYIQE